MVKKIDFGTNENQVIKRLFGFKINNKNNEQKLKGGYNMKFKIYSIIILLSIICFAQEVYEIEPVVVVATRYPRNIMEITRTVTIIDSSEIIKYSSLSEILETIAGIDMKTRGDNIQADPGIRGSTFQQVLIMIDGIRVNDPQTGHHNLNIPIPLDAIERIEILHGTASSLYGSDACGGVINIITKKPKGYGCGLGVGSFGYRSGFGKFTLYKASIDFETNSSTGYEPGYEYALHNISAKYNTTFKNNDFGILVGYLNKKFGAKNFYAPFPSWEANQAFFISVNNKWIVSPYFMLNPILSFRTHIDTFVLDRNRPDFYANRHQSFTYGSQIIGHLDLKKFGYFTSGIELYRDSLNSTRLGIHSLQRGAIFLQIEKKYFNERMIIISGIRDDYYWNIKNSINPHISFAYKILPSLKFSSSFGNSFRAPSFTELYYRDPANKGDSLLKPEYAWEYESGLEFYSKRFTGSFCSFYRKTEDDIDWVKREGETIWQAKNIARAIFQGFETNLRFLPESWFSFNAGFTYLTIKTELPGGYISKYALRVPEFTFTGGFSVFSIFALNCRWNKYYESEVNQFYLNSLLKKSIRILSRHSMDLSFMIENILDKKYEDYMNVPLPGRELKFKLSIKGI